MKAMYEILKKEMFFPRGEARCGEHLGNIFLEQGTLRLYGTTSIYKGSVRFFSHAMKDIYPEEHWEKLLQELNRIWEIKPRKLWKNMDKEQPIKILEGSLVDFFKYFSSTAETRKLFLNLIGSKKAIFPDFKTGSRRIWNLKNNEPGRLIEVRKEEDKNEILIRYEKCLVMAEYGTLGAYASQGMNIEIRILQPVLTCL